MSLLSRENVKENLEDWLWKHLSYIMFTTDEHDVLYPCPVLAMATAGRFWLLVLLAASEVTCTFLFDGKVTDSKVTGGGWTVSVDVSFLFYNFVSFSAPVLTTSCSVVNKHTRFHS